ncbi:MAG: hypothetical protein ACOYJJ_04885 [Anaerovoracaceae bacterium]|jgi:hypothetical protein
MQPGSIVIFIAIIALLVITVLCVRKTITDDAEIQKMFEEENNGGDQPEKNA